MSKYGQLINRLHMKAPRHQRCYSRINVKRFKSLQLFVMFQACSISERLCKPCHGCCIRIAKNLYFRKRVDGGVQQSLKYYWSYWRRLIVCAYCPENRANVLLLQFYVFDLNESK